jgi:NRAMP (natural resistance-associated macrophage protein)-like metal ion transporter
VRRSLAPLLAVIGPGILAGLSDDDPGGITTYSILGADHGYALLWVLVIATGMLILFHLIGVRLGAVTGQGLAGLVREHYGVRAAALCVGALVVANLGTTCAEFAGVAAALGLAGVPAYLSVPAAAVGIVVLVVAGSFHRVERVLLVLAATLGLYIAAGFLAGPDWGATLHGALVPSQISTRTELLAVTATVGTTIAPWGLAFIQSYAVDKRLRPQDLRLERIDVITGAVMTGVIGLFVVVACAATIHVDGGSIEDAGDAAKALEPLAGAWSARLFGAGLLGAALLAAAILPLSTAYSVAESFGTESRIDDRPQEARLFYGTYLAVTAVAALFVMIPGLPLVPVLFLSQVLNAILLVPLLVFALRLAGDTAVMGRYASSRLVTALGWLTVAAIAACVVALGVASL